MKNHGKGGVVLTKLLISQLLRDLEYQTCLKINVKTYHGYELIRYANDYYIIFMNIDETMRI